jgi:hypothetical protein
MSTRLQGHVHSRPTKVVPLCPAVFESRSLRVQIAELGVKPLTDNLAITHNDSSNKRIRTDPPPPALRKLTSPPQVSFIRACELRIHRTD